MAGISNRESPEAEATDRREHPPADTTDSAPEDAAERVAAECFPDPSMPATHKVAGAFGKEPKKEESQ